MSVCLNWPGTIDANGYGRAGREYAHRAAWRAVHGDIPDRHVIHHTCENKRCVNIEHLACLTHAEHNAHHLNARAWYEHVRARTRCLHGHAYTPENTHVRRDGRRECRTCMRDRMRRRRAAA